jgi:uncharacterized protein YxjI
MLRRRLGRDDDGGDAPSAAYRMRQRMLAIGDDFWIETGAGERAFQVDGKALRVRKTFVLKDSEGQEVYKIRERMLRIRDTMEIEGSEGTVATVKKALVSPLRERYNVDLAGGEEWKVQGNLVDHEYEIEGPGGQIASVSKRWFRVRDSYGVEIAPGQDDALVLAVTIVVDQLAHPAR